METFKHIINELTRPTIMLTVGMLSFLFFFPPNDWFGKWNKRLRLNFLWTKKGFALVMISLVGFFLYGMTDENFKLIIVLYSIKQAVFMFIVGKKTNFNKFKENNVVNTSVD